MPNATNRLQINESMNKEQIESYLQEYGFSDFKWIAPKDIVIAQWVRVKCEFGCSDYGLGTCPPNTPTVQECRVFFKEYRPEGQSLAFRAIN
jgi:predicted metal-binding protein